jgi:Domain of unknown function (DUF4384)
MQTKTPFVWLMAVGMGAACLAGQEGAGMDARDAFYSASDLLGKKPKPPQPDTVVKRPPPKDPEQYFQTVAKTERALGLRYSLLKEVDGDLVETSPGMKFSTGDLIRLSVMGNQKAWLYVVGRGASGEWLSLFPNANSGQRSNELIPGRKYQIPGGTGQYFKFDEPPGTERLFILMSKQPVSDPKELVRGLKRSESPSAPADPKWNDTLMAGLRETVERDIVNTTIDEPAGAQNPSGDKAIYVVNHNPAHGDFLVVDVVLEHR